MAVLYMTDDKWNDFMMTGKISDYLEYRKSAEQSAAKVGEESGDGDASGNSPQGVSGW